MQEISRPRNQDAANLFDNCRGSSTNRPLFMQNKANFCKGQMNANSIITRDYEKRWALRVEQKQSQSNPIILSILISMCDDAGYSKDRQQ
jgi:hypothetical protein